MAIGTSRSNDTAPWSGGILWRNVDEDTGCSTSFAFRKSGTNVGPYILSSGHCGHINNVAQDLHGENIGIVTHRRWSGAQEISALLIIEGNVRFRVWTGENSGVWVDRAPKEVMEGERVSVDGGVTGLVRGTLVTGVDLCRAVEVGGESATVCHMDRTESGVPACRDGESGGPIIQFHSGEENVSAIGSQEAMAPGDLSTCYFNRIWQIIIDYQIYLLGR